MSQKMTVTCLRAPSPADALGAAGAGDGWPASAAPHAPQKRCDGWVSAPQDGQADGASRQPHRAQNRAPSALSLSQPGQRIARSAVVPLTLPSGRSAVQAGLRAADSGEVGR